MQCWVQLHCQHKEFPSFLCWGIWRAKNSSISEGKLARVHSTCINIIGLFNEYFKLVAQKGKILVPSLTLPEDGFFGFFDGAKANNSRGCGMVVQINATSSFQIWMGAGIGTNTRAELLALWGLLLFASL